MKTNWDRRCQRLVWLNLIICSIFFLKFPAWASQYLSGLSPKLQTTIQQQVEKDLLRIQSVRREGEVVFTATNRQQSYQAEFRETGVQVNPIIETESSDWRLAFRFIDYGYGEKMQTASPPTLLRKELKLN